MNREVKLIYRFIVLDLVLLFMPLYSGYSQIKKEGIKKVIIEYANFMIMTTEAVKCPYFKTTFNGSLKAIVINDSKGLRLLASNIGKMIPLGDRKSIDVRLMITLCYKQTEIKYCMDRFGVFVDSAGRYLDNKLLYGFIIEQLPVRERVEL